MRLYSVLLLLVAALAGCSDVAGADQNESVVVFVLDSPINVDFLEGRVVGLRASDVTHGSLVGRVLRGYCRAPLMCVTAEGIEGSPDRSAYLSGLRSVLDHVRQHPDVKLVVNISLAFPAPAAEEEELIRRITAAGALVVAAAGNEDSAAPMYPAAYPGVVAVASATRDGKALNSNFGPHINIAASGDISFIDYEFLPYERLRREMEARGTSFAAPRVAATAAYLMRHDPRLSPREAYRILESTAGPMDDAYYRDGMLGAGLLDIYRAKCVVSPTYRFVHFVLPVSIWIVLGVI
ncbi:MAG: S8 family serine peptidase, partial [Candidatus Brocadiae bacterium]|nr:S8 family serine peptidase [Candidatus Brocadiia bacterium]